MMKIAISNSIFFTQKSGGISRYFVEISKEIIKKNDHDLKIISPINKNSFLREVSKKNKVSLYVKRYPNFKLLKIFNNFISQIYLDRFNPDIYHETYFNINFNLKKKTKKIITVYDMIHEKFQSFYIKDQINQKKKIIDSYDHFICISENTKNDFIEFYKVPESKVSVTYLAGNHFSSTKRNIIPKNEKDLFILYM